MLLQATNRNKLSLNENSIMKQNKLNIPKNGGTVTFLPGKVKLEMTVPFMILIGFHEGSNEYASFNLKDIIICIWFRM